MSRELRRAFIDIINGWTSIKLWGQTVYLRHLTHRDHLDLEELQNRFYEEAVAEGLSDAKTRDAHLRSIGHWDDKKERAILDQAAYVNGMTMNKKNVHLPSLLEKIEEQLKNEKEKLAILENEKAELVGLTAEIFASRRCNDYYVIRSLYRDPACKQSLFDEATYDDLSDDEVSLIVRAYNQAVDVCSDRAIKKLCIQDFYQSYYYLCEDDFYQFFGRPIADFTFYQIKLANYSRYFKQILEGVDLNTLPEKVRDEPDDLISYLDVQKKGKEMLGKSDSGMVSLVGATKEDIKAITGEEKVNALPNKRMNMKELMQHMKK